MRTWDFMTFQSFRFRVKGVWFLIETGKRAGNFWNLGVNRG